MERNEGDGVLGIVMATSGLSTLKLRTSLAKKKNKLTCPHFSHALLLLS